MNEFFVAVLHQDTPESDAKLEAVCDRLKGAAHLHVEKFKPFPPMPIFNEVGHESLRRALETNATHIIVVMTEVLPCANFLALADQIADAHPNEIVCYLGGEPSAFMAPGWFTSADGLAPFFSMPVAAAKDYLAFHAECLNDYGHCGTLDTNIVTFAQYAGAAIVHIAPNLLEGQVPPDLVVDFTGESQAFVGRITPDRHWRLITALKPEYRKVRLAYDIERARPILGTRLKEMTNAQQQTPKQFAAPASMQPHIRKVLLGEYDFPLMPAFKEPVILDLGANVGSFAIWANRRFPGCKIHCYEPHPDNVKLLTYNVETFSLPVEVHPVAVTAGGLRVRLYDGKNNCGEASLFKGDEQTGEGQDVESIQASDLPPADFVKIDTEGCEWDIIVNYKHWDKVGAVALEWRSKEDRDRIVGYLLSQGLDLVKDEHDGRDDRGVMGFARAMKHV